MNRTIALIILFLLNNLATVACSMYKITVGDKTMVGCNEDAWRTTPRIWFETAKSKNEYGVCFTGSRVVGENQFAPQSGMNEAGLVYSKLASFHPQMNIDLSTKKKIGDPIAYLRNIMHKCKSIEDVKNYISQYDHSYFMEDVFIYIEKSGRYLIVEPYELITGNSPSYVLANFCPSITSNEQSRNQNRYRCGMDFLKLHQIDTTLSFCKALSDTMKVCRNRNGDGTLLTTNWDSKYGLVNLYFYHRYNSTVQFNIVKELAKGDHVLNIVELFPSNKEFKNLQNYKNPYNVDLLRISLLFIAVFYALSSILFLISYFKRSSDNYQTGKLFLSILSLILTAYMFVLVTNKEIYYFDAPYVHYSNVLISISSYTPFLLVISILPFFKIVKANNWSNLLKGLLIINFVLYILCVCMFAYWGLYTIIH